MELMALWSRNRRDCRPVGSIVADARAGELPGVRALPGNLGFEVTDKQAALAAMINSKPLVSRARQV